LKKSSPGLTDGSIFFGSSGGGFFSVCPWGAATAANEQRTETMMAMNDFMILETE
jgi:hypothetical protein